MPDITTFLTFNNQAEEAAKLYVSLFDGKIVNEMRMPEGGPAPAGTLLTVTFELFGKQYIALNGGPTFTFTQGFSLFVLCDTQAEIDRYWSKLTEGGKEIQCGWLVDRFGVSWQIVPRVLQPMISDKDPKKAGRAMGAMMQMQKLDIATLKRAFEGA